MDIGEGAITLRVEASYAARLGAAGGHLDRHDLHSIQLVEVTDGLIIRAMRGDRRQPELLEFVYGPSSAVDGPDDTPAGAQHDSYAVFLRALGDRLDRCAACSITIAEGTNFIAVGWRSPGEYPSGSDEEFCEDFLLAEDVRALQFGADSRRPGPKPGGLAPVTGLARRLIGKR